MATISQQIARNAGVVAGATLLSRILGLVRDLVIAFALGTGPLADAFFIAFRLPNLLRRLFAEGSLTIAFIPVFTRMVQTEGRERAYRLARSVNFWLLIILGIIVILAIVFARPITQSIAIGFQAKDPQILDFTVSLVRICFPYIFFISAVALCMGILNSMDHFLAPALAPCILNLCMIGAALLAYLFDLNVPVALSYGVLVAGLGQWLLQQPFLKKIGFSWTGPWNVMDRGVKRIGRLMGPSIFGASVYQLNILLSTVLASLLPFGSISYLYYADRLVQFPLGVFGIAISTAALPGLSSLASDPDKTDFKAVLNSTLSLTFFISLPAAAGLIALSQPIISVIFERGAFTAEAVQGTSLALMAFSLGLPATSTIRSLASAFYAHEDTKTPVYVASICLAVNIGLGYLLMQFMAHVGLALATSVSSWINIILLGYFLRRKIGPWNRIRAEIIKMTLLSLIILAGAYLTHTSGLLALSLIPLWVGLYLVGAFLLGLKETSLVISLARRSMDRLSRDRKDKTDRT